MATTSVVLERAEHQIERLRAGRPHLDTRITKAEHILVTHFAMPDRRIIKGRIHGDKLVWLVKGSHGAVYTVSPRDWSCSCPDHHRRGGTCKHALATWALSAPLAPRVSRDNPLRGVADPDRLDKLAERLGV